MRTIVAVTVSAILGLSACGKPGTDGKQEFVLAHRADSVAMRAYESAGGPDVWSRVPYLRFDFAVEAGGQKGPSRRHLWDRMSGNYRLEWKVGADTTVVALFNVNTREGHVFINGAAAGTEARAAILEQAYTRFVNDTYWLLSPIKMMDPGARREYVADSSTAEVDVIALTFESVGLTPGDRYWVSVGRQDGMVKRWSYILQGWNDRPANCYHWVGYRTLETPFGPVRVAERKEAVARNRAILTENVRLPERVDPDAFANPAAILE